jgi:hypothetical protein
MVGATLLSNTRFEAHYMFKISNLTFVTRSNVEQRGERQLVVILVRLK